MYLAMTGVIGPSIFATTTMGWSDCAWVAGAIRLRASPTATAQTRVAMRRGMARHGVTSFSLNYTQICNSGSKGLTSPRSHDVTQCPGTDLELVLEDDDQAGERQ